MNVTRPLHTLAVGLTALGMTAASLATANAIGALRGHALEVRSLQAYYSAST